MQKRKKLAEKKFKNIKTGKKEVFKTIVNEQKFGDDIISTYLLNLYF